MTQALRLKACSLFIVVAITGVLSACGGSTTPAAATPATPTTTGTPPPASTQSPDGPPTVFNYSNIDDMSGWQFCIGCAGGRATVNSTLSQHEAQPSLTGSAAHFTMTGKTKFSNVFWWKHLLDAKPKATKYRYEFSVFMKNPEAPEALEFDANQSDTGIRWMMGTECNFKDSHRWDVWDASAKWVPTSVPCTQFPANQWTHVAWNFERVDDRVRYVSVEVNGVVYPVNVELKAEKNWPWGGAVDVAFQMDGDVNQAPVDVWLDDVSIKGW